MFDCVPALALFLLLVIVPRFDNPGIGIGVPRNGAPGRCGGAAEFCRSSRLYLGDSPAASGFAGSKTGYGLTGIL